MRNVTVRRAWLSAPLACPCLNEKGAVFVDEEAMPKMQHSPEFLKLVNESKKSIRELTVDQVMQKIQAGEKFYFVDCREDDEWRAGHCEGAVHLGRGVLERDIEEEIPGKTEPIVIYCGGGFRSALAAESIQKMGYKNVISMDGGFKGWKQKGYPITQD